MVRILDEADYRRRLDAAVEISTGEEAAALPKGTLIRCVPLSEMLPWNELCSDLPWRTRRAEAGYLPEKSYGFRGVYRLFAFADDIRRPAVLNRLCGQDVTGTLYIGMATSLSSRLNLARRSAAPPRDGRRGIARRLSPSA